MSYDSFVVCADSWHPDCVVSEDRFVRVDRLTIGSTVYIRGQRLSSAFFEKYRSTLHDMILGGSGALGASYVDCVMFAAQNGDVSTAQEKFLAALRR